MSTLKTIRVRNIQAMGDVLVELPKTGLVVFVGENSNGKSIIRKALEDIIAYNIKSPRVRKSLINNKVSEGTIELTKWDGTSLFVNLNVEASLTWVCLRRSNGDEEKRYLSDKTIPDLVNEFGFHYNEKRGICLNICDSDDAILFFNTNYVTNGDVLNSALTDKGVVDRCETLKGVYREASVMRQTFSDNLRMSTLQKESIVLHDVDVERDLMVRSQMFANILSHVYIPDIVEPEPIPDVVYVPLPSIRISTYKVPLVIDLPKVNIKPIDNLFKDFMTVEKGVCPTCGKPFSSHQTYTNGM